MISHTRESLSGAAMKLPAAASARTAIYMILVGQSLTDPLNSLMTLASISAVTHARIPLKACATITLSMKLLKNAAIIRMSIAGMVTTPSVAAIPPAIPACCDHIKVAVFTAITPGVH